MMNPKQSRMKKLRALLTLFFVLIFALSTSSLLAHGGKKHEGEEFSTFQAVQKATKLYDQLISKGKLPETWEIGLNTINIEKRQSSGKLEFVVQFSRTEGDPASVYFFFDQKGKYSGSNFTGK